MKPNRNDPPATDLPIGDAARGRESSAECFLLTERDAGILRNVDPDVFDNPVDPALSEAFLRAPGNVIAVAVAGNMVVGMASGFTYLHPDKPLQLFINEVGVSSRYQRRGLARQLVSLLLARGRELGCVEAWVATEEDNTAARALYASLDGVEDPDRAVVYTYKLSPDGKSAEEQAE